MTMKKLSLIIAASAALLLPAAPALAHAMLDHASPPVGSSTATAPASVALWFTEKLEPAFSTIEVRNTTGSVVSSGKAQVDRADRTQLRVSLKPLAAGTYKVIWRVLSVDTHRTQGDFTFRVGP
jgi:methionine-rich copper-binding protein CopC